MPDILIRGTYFPTKGHRTFRIYADGRVEGEYTGLPLGAATELPPHGDLISRDEALKAMEWKWAGKAAFEAVKNVPAIVPASEEETNHENP